LLTVTTLADVDLADGECSLREAIIAANTDLPYRECPAGGGADEIVLAAAGTLALVADLPDVQAALTVRGLGAAESAIDGGDAFEIFHFTGAATGNGERLRVEELMLTGGLASEGGAIYAGSHRALEVVGCVLVDNHATLDGGAVRADLADSTRIESSWLAANSAVEAGGGLAVWGGSLEIVDSTLSGNSAQGANGGAVYVLSASGVTILRSTISGNAARADGGGVAAVSVGAGGFRLESSTVVGNTADVDDLDAGNGGGLAVAGGMTATLVNSLLAGNGDATTVGAFCPDGARKLGAAVVTAGFNLVGAHECLESTFPAGLPNVNGDQVGTAAAPVEALLEPLGSFGGPTPTHLPTAASPAVDQGGCPGDLRDQRGYYEFGGLRVVDDPLIADLGDGCDSGAVERGALAGPLFRDGFESGDTGGWPVAVP
jgi:CSLREA domain-containing protein